MSILYIVATPIGNLTDMTFRAIETLKGVDLVLAEDTRHTRILLDRYEIKKPIVSYHQHSKLTKIDFAIDKLREGQNLALVSDAGTPGISDPGEYLIQKVLEALPETEIIPIPGASSPIAALSISGFSSDRFVFLGFLPKKKGRQTLLNSIREEEKTMVFFESPHRIRKTLGQLAEYLGKDRQVVACRELTKMFEDISRGTLEELSQTVKEKGEFVVVVAGK